MESALAVPRERQLLYASVPECPLSGSAKRFISYVAGGSGYVGITPSCCMKLN
jgi:hypothetical protein